MRYFSCDRSSLPKYLICGQLISENGFVHQNRCLGEHVLIMVNEGTLYVKTNGVEYCVSRGQSILLKAGELHMGYKESAGRLSYLWVHFNAELSEINAPDSVEAGQIYFPEYGLFSPSGRATILFHQLSDISFEEDERSIEMCHHALNMLLLELSRENSSEYDTYSDLPVAVASAMEYVSMNYYSSFTVADLASKFGYTTDYFSSLFKKSTGISLVSYINTVRIRASKALIASNGVTIKEAAYSCGFPDEKYYMRVFKKIEGMTPTEYKNTCGKSVIVPN